MENYKSKQITKELSLLGKIVDYPFLIYPNHPTIAEVLEWLRIEKRIYLTVLPFQLKDEDDVVALCWYYIIVDLNRTNNICCDAVSLNAFGKNFETFDETLAKGLIDVFKNYI